MFSDQDDDIYDDLAGDDDLDYNDVEVPGMMLVMRLFIN